MVGAPEVGEEDDQDEYKDKDDMGMEVDEQATTAGGSDRLSTVSETPSMEGLDTVVSLASNLAFLQRGSA